MVIMVRVYVWEFFKGARVKFIPEMNFVEKLQGKRWGRLHEQKIAKSFLRMLPPHLINHRA